MNLHIGSDHLLDDVTYSPAHDRGHAITPKVIVIHYTAGSTAQSSVSWLSRKDRYYVSAHTVISRTGEITQLVPFNIEAYHAGVSEWNGQKWVNNFGIGIELANWGYLNRTPQGLFTYTGRQFPQDKAERGKHKFGTPDGWWESFPEVQMRSAARLVVALKHRYPTIKDVVGHDDISPGRKQDPGPAWDWDKFNGYVTAYQKAAKEEAATAGIPTARPQSPKATTHVIHAREEEIIAACSDAIRKFRD